MKNLTNQILCLLNCQKLKFLIVGGLNTGISYLLFLLLDYWWGYRYALILTYFIGINISVITMRFLVFPNNKPFAVQYLKAVITYIMMLLVNYIALHIMIEQLLWPTWLAQAVFTIFSTIAVFYIHKNLNFNA